MKEVRRCGWYWRDEWCGKTAFGPCGINQPGHRHPEEWLCDEHVQYLKQSHVQYLLEKSTE